MTTLNFVDRDEGKAAIAEVRKDGSPSDWVLFGYDSAKADAKFVLMGKGSGGIDALAQNLKDDIVAYGLVRKTDQIDDSTTVKFAFINFLGDNVPRMQKARISVQQGAVKEFIGQFHVDINASSRDELTDSLLAEKIGLTSGSGSRVLNRQTGEREGGSASRTSAAVNVKAGGDLNFSDQNQLKSEIQDVRADSTDTNWVLFSYADDTSNTVVLKGKGSDGVSGLLNELDDKTVGYGLVRKIEKIDDSETVKFAYVRFVGENIPRMLKARLGTHTGALASFFHPYHVTIEASEKSEISDEIIDKAIKNAAGTAVHVREQGHSQPATTTWAGRTGTPTSSSSVPSSKAPVVPKALNSEQGLKYADESQVKDAIKAVRSDADDTNWALVGYEGGKGSTLVLLGSGSGGLEELLPHLKDEIVAYGLLRTTDQIDNSVTVKFVHLNWVGEKIDRMHRARLGTHKGQVGSLFTPFHVDINATQLSEITPELVKEKVQDASGSGSKVKN
eukprot:TRINITY_DN339_c0_g1_i1.p1 TRINITY_DN339_c0_g1~~TRINITY_DN339_c0_g1_i1.p1  ORF type:complete len:503 (+),score=236.61 TRINITY_DN339_c0_g1_i1:179-1687(+)